MRYQYVCTYYYVERKEGDEEEENMQDKRSVKGHKPPFCIRKEQKKKRKIREIGIFSSHFFFVVLLRLFCQTKEGNMSVGPTTNRPLTKTFCETCRKAFTPRDPMQIYQDRYYHPQCFCCSQCGNSLAGKPFYPKPNNQFQCENCNNSLAPK